MQTLNYTAHTSLQMDGEDIICDGIDLVRLLENDEDLLQNELNECASNDDNQLNFENIFEDDSIEDKDTYKAEPDMAFDPFLMTSDSSFSDLKKMQIEPVKDQASFPPKVFHAVPPLRHNHSQPMFQVQPPIQVPPRPRTSPHEQFQNWSSCEQPITQVPQYGRKSPFSAQSPAPVMQTKTFEQHFEDRKQNLWSSMQKSAMSKANINHMRKGERRHSMTSLKNSRPSSNVDNSRQQLQATFVNGTPSVNQHARAPRRVSMDMYHKPMYQAQMNSEFHSGFVQQAQQAQHVQHTQPYQNQVEHMNPMDHNNAHHMAPPKALRRSSWHGGQTCSPLQQAQQGHSIHPIPTQMQYAQYP